MEEFNKYCHLFNHLGEVGFVDESSEYDQTFILCRRLFHLGYLLLVPMNLPFAWCLPFLSSLSLALFKKPRTRQGSIVTVLFSEEFTNVGLIIMILFSGKLMKWILQLALCIWSLMHVADLARWRLSNAPDTPVLVSLKGFFDQVAYSKVELCLIKANIEWAVAILSVPAVFVR